MADGSPVGQFSLITSVNNPSKKYIRPSSNNSKLSLGNDALNQDDDFNNTLFVGGNTQISGNTVFGGELNAQGVAYLYNGVQIIGGLQLDGISGDINVSGNADITGNAKITGIIQTSEVRVCLNPGTCPDYVFEKNYNLMNLDDLERYLQKEKHLPNVPSAKEMEGNGMNMKEMNLQLLRKVEELTLYVLQLKNEIKNKK